MVAGAVISSQHIMDSIEEEYEINWRVVGALRSLATDKGSWEAQKVKLSLQTMAIISRI